MSIMMTPDNLIVRQYRFPKRGDMGTLVINGQEVPAAHTKGRGKEYTYFQYNDVSYYVDGKLEFWSYHTVEFPEGYQPRTPRSRNVEPEVQEGPEVREEPEVREVPAPQFDQ